MENIESFWTKIKSQIRQTIPDHSYRMWIDPVELLTFDENLVCLSAPNEFFTRRLKENYLEVFQNEFVKLGQDVKIEFKTQERNPKKNQAPVNGGHPAIPIKTPKAFQTALPGFDSCFMNGRMMKKGYTFDDFVVGDNSSFAYSASLSLAKGTINGAGILYLLGKTGLGKSHLSQAAGHHIISSGLSSRVYYVTAEDFTNEMISALKTSRIEKFKEKYRTQCDVLILEDIHFLAGKMAIQNELAITLDYLLDADKKIIFSGCERPDDIPKLNEQLKSRLSMGLITEISTPDFNTRVKILKKKAEPLCCIIPTDVIEYIAQELCDDVRQLESGLFGVAAKGEIMKQNIDIHLAKSVLANLTQQRKRITIELIKELVCREFAVTPKEIISKSRKKKIVRPRQVAMFLAKKYTDLPIKKIGSSFKRYHATAIYSVNAVEKEMKHKGVLFEQINYLSEKLESGKY